MKKKLLITLIALTILLSCQKKEYQPRYKTYYYITTYSAGKVIGEWKTRYYGYNNYYLQFRDFNGIKYLVSGDYIIEKRKEMVVK